MSKLDYKIVREFSRQEVREFSIDIGDFGYLCIVGKHVNGMFICIPNWGLGCELSGSPDSVAYNAGKIAQAGAPVGISKSTAKAIAQAIYQIYDLPFPEFSE